MGVTQWHDLRGQQQIGAAFTPAPQLPYSQFVYRNRDAKLRCADLYGRDLDLLDPNNRLCVLKYVLASAYLWLNSSNDIVTMRNRLLGSTVIVDSGGYSLIETDFIPTSRDALALLEVQLALADKAITLDVPTRAIATGRAASFGECLTRTMDYLKLYERQIGRLKHIRAIPDFANVLQGTSEGECQTWYDTVKQVGFTSAWAFAGAKRLDFKIVVTRLVQMLKQGHLQNCNWIHFLGTGSHSSAAILSAVQQTLRMVLKRPDFTVTFDDSYSAVNVEKYYKLHVSSETDDMAFKIARMLELKRYYHDPLLRFPWQNSPVGRMLRMGDLAVQSGDNWWDAESRSLLKNHATFVRVEGLSDTAAKSDIRFAPEHAVTMLKPHIVLIQRLIFEILFKGRTELIGSWGNQLTRIKSPLPGLVKRWEQSGYQL